ncbi:hypothetical protein LAV60_15375 [Clostridium sporogenes]|uniref:hypothetical protein n=1 Tax=Clostridium sporogenes TaxID=1509 RepID=UPI002238F1AD|nr:hypothetical protein [Clostridium sporogenes]MCW6094551.1 hypothetical protein [Clostridium sporogenes]
MLGFIPMNRTASVYRQVGAVDSWGRPTTNQTFTGKCQINYNTDLTKISGEDGVTTSMSATVVFHGLVEVAVGDYVEFSDILGVTNKYQIKDVFFFEDYVGKIIATRVVVGNGKRS